MRLTVTSSGRVKNLLNFVGGLRQNTQLRLLRLEASNGREACETALEAKPDLLRKRFI